MNKQNRNRLRDTAARGKGVGGTGKIGERGEEVQTSSYKTNKSQRCNVQQREDSQ